MKTTIATLGWIMVLFTIHAQPVISDSWIPQPGDTWKAAITLETPDHGQSGANVTWDYSDLNVDNFSFQVIFNWIDPAGTEYLDSFPSATVCADFEGFALGYYRDDGSSFEYLGSGSQYGLDIFFDPQSIEYIGLKFEDTVVDSYKVVRYNNFTDPDSSMGLTSYTYDAYGTLILPNATITDAIRIFQMDVEADSSVSGGLSTVRIDSLLSYAWIAEGSVFPVAQWQISTSYSRIYVNGQLFSEDVEGPDTTFSINPDYGIVSLTTQASMLPTLDIFPTVARDRVNINSIGSSPLEYAIIALNGSRIDSGLLTGDLSEVDISSFDPGYYVIKVDGYTPEVFLKME